MVEIKLFWRAKPTKAGRFPESLLLKIYPATKAYQKIADLPAVDMGVGYGNDVEVKRRSDITDMIKYLEGEGYKEYPEELGIL